jgi:hypothetical protein
LKLNDQRLGIELAYRPHWRNRECHRQTDHAVDATARSLFRKFSIACRIGLDDIGLDGFPVDPNHPVYRQRSGG